MRWPSTFIPDEDDGYFIAVVQLPPAASLERTQAVGDKINAILDSYPEVEKLHWNHWFLRDGRR